MGIYKAKIDCNNYEVWTEDRDRKGVVFSIPTSSVKGYYFNKVSLSGCRLPYEYHFCLITTLGIFDFTELGYTTSFGSETCNSAKTLIDSGITKVSDLVESETIVADLRLL